MTKPRLISVVVPTCDRPAFLREALASIRAIEGPDVKFEILVGDNGKDARTKDVADAFGAVYLRVDARGAGAARNAGLKAATGEFTAFLDDDDVWTADAVRGQLAVLDADATLEGAFGQIVSTDQDLRPLSDPWPEESPGEGDELVRTMLSGYYPQIGGTLVRTCIRDIIGYFDERLLGDQDWDWQLRLARRRHVGFSSTRCVLFRQRPPGSFDKLRKKRLGFTRRVFFRHALPERRLWKSPVHLARAYTQVVWQYYEYFVGAANARVDAGEKSAARSAIWGAFRTFPFRAAFHLLSRTPLRHAFVGAYTPRRSPALPERPSDALRK